MTQIRVRVLFFAGLRERAGTGKAELELPAGSTVADAISRAQKATPRPWKSATRIMTAVNEEYVPDSHTLQEGDELALIPPVSGGAIGHRQAESASQTASASSADYIEITAAQLEPTTFANRVRAEADGAVVTFEGVTRNHNEGRRVLYLEYEAYRPMADRKIAELIGEMRARWPIDRVAVGHRTGRVDIGETSLVIAVSAAHRRAAFEAALYFVDRLKEVVPIWKKEYFEGGEVWIGDAEHPQGSGTHSR